MHECCESIKKTIDNIDNIEIPVTVHILYIGDFDPSGDDMDRYIREELDFAGLSEVIFKRIAVTPEQIKKYKLPYNPDKVTKEKLDRDNRSRAFEKKYGKLYATEVEAFSSIQT
jgi:hypothetical protein